MGGSRDSCYRAHRLMDVFVVPTPVRLGSSVSLGLGPPQAYLRGLFTLTCNSVATVFSRKGGLSEPNGASRVPEKGLIQALRSRNRRFPPGGRRIGGFFFGSFVFGQK